MSNYRWYAEHRGLAARRMGANPLTLVYVTLAAGSVGLLGHQMLRGKHLALPPAIAILWASSLAVGWVLKLIIGPNYW